MSARTEATVRAHVAAFLEQRGVPALLAEYHEEATGR